MKIYVREINKCTECPYAKFLFNFTNQMKCSKTGRFLKYEKRIKNTPKWCPLPDKEEK